MPRPPSNTTKTNENKNRKAGTGKQPMVDRARNPKEATAIKGSEFFITEDEFRARVAFKAYELYLQRQAMTEADDWLQAERLVKEELLAQRQHAGSV